MPCNFMIFHLKLDQGPHPKNHKHISAPRNPQQERATSQATLVSLQWARRGSKRVDGKWPYTNTASRKHCGSGLASFPNGCTSACLCWATSYLSVTLPASSVRCHISIWQPLLRQIFCDRETLEVRLHCTQAYVPTPQLSSGLKDDAFFIAPDPSAGTTTYTFRVSHFTPSPSEDVAY